MGGRIVVLGIFVADTTYRAARMPRPGETILGSGFALGPGGKGSNQAIAAARAGGDVRLLTRLGRDDFGTLARKIWDGAGVTPVVIEGETPTGAACIFVNEATGENAIIVSAGAAGEIGVADIDRWGREIDAAAFFVTQLEQPLDAAAAALARARAAGAVTILNPAPAARLPGDMLAHCDWVTPNESEAEGLTGVAVDGPDSARAAAERLRQAGAGGAVITLGAQGALLLDASGAAHVPAVAAGAVAETTGAGDAFNGAFVAALADGATPVAALRFGVAAAGISVTRPGAANSMPSRAEIDALIA